MQLYSILFNNELYFINTCLSSVCCIAVQCMHGGGIWGTNRNMGKVALLVVLNAHS